MTSRFRSFGLALSTFLLAFASLAAQETPAPAPQGKQIPPPLVPWTSWALWNDDHRFCPTPYSDAEKHLCFWPSRLGLQVDKEGGRFDLGVTVYHETWVPLPGNQDVWPLEVTVGGAPVPVVEHGGKPAVQLPAGTHELRGVFRWNEIPQRIALPQEIGLLSLTLDGTPVPSPSWDAQGLLWLKRDGASEEVDKDFLSLKMYAALDDGIPLWWRVEIELIVSGKSREEQLGSILPEGWKLASVESPIPVVVDDAGRLKAQVRAGRWTIRADAFRIDNPKELKFAEGAKPAAPDVLVAFRSKPDFRMVEIGGAPSIDVSQTTLPDRWRELPVYRWEPAVSPLQIEERMRGMGDQKPAGLTIGRELWLDEKGAGLIFRDQISGAMQQVWRLDAAEGQDLGSVRSNGEGQLITRNPANGAPGVEIRNRTINLEATGRMPRNGSGVSATGWRADADSVNVTLNLPPGWRLFALFGADWVEGDWLTSWTLLDLFLLLIFTLAVFRLWGLAAGVIAFLAFGLTYHEPGAPVFAWLVLLIPLALSRVVPQGWASRVLSAAKWLMIVVLLVILVPFVGRQIQQALYPQLESIGSRRIAAMSASADFAAAEGALHAPAAAGIPSSDAEITRKLEQIVIPRVEFREATLRDAIDYLQKQSVALDTEEQNPSRRGVKIMLKSMPEGLAVPGLELPPSALLTTSLKNIPLGEALRYVTGLANMKYKVESGGVTVVSQGTPTDSIITKEIAVSPDFLTETSSGGVRRRIQPSNVKSLLEAEGMTFPPGAQATYITETGRLIVRNTQENIDLLDSLIPAGVADQPARNLGMYDGVARIQTGPGVPEWNWRTVRFGWNSPVEASQEVRPVLISSLMSRVLSIVRVALVVALAGVLLNVRNWRGKVPPASAPAAAVIAVLFGLLSGMPAFAEIPDQATLQQLRQRLLEKSDAFPNAAAIPSVALTLRDRNLTIEADIHVAAESAVPLPGRLPSFSPVSVAVDNKPTVSIRRDDGFLWVVLPKGVHRVRMDGLLANVGEWEWTYRLKPRSVKVDAPDWNVSGIRPDGVPGQQVVFSKKQTAAPGEAASYEQQNLQSIALVERSLDLGLVWHVRTSVSRLSPVGRAIVLRIPLLPGESVLSSYAIVRDGTIEVRLGAQDQSFTWESRLGIQDKLTLATRAEDPWVERWHLVASPIWNITPGGLAPMFDQGSTALTPVWQPWPGESVELAITRPEAIAGTTVTVDRATHTVSLGRRQRTSKLELSLRCSVGEDFLIDLPADAEITSLLHSDKQIPVRKDGSRLVVPVRPGEQKVTVEWKMNAPLGFVAKGEAIRLPVESANIYTVIEVPQDRWVLWAYGPLRGPAVRFWGILAVSLLAAWALGRLSLSPLRTYEWMLLGVGLTQIPLFAAMIVVAWLFLLAWRGQPAFQQLGTLHYNLLQALLIGVTAIALGIFVAIVAEGLLGNPEMFIEGNDSTREYLRWYQARAESLLTQPACFSVSIWWYRFLMLLWALWLAASLIRWMRKGWEHFSSGGFFRRKPKTPVAPPPLRTSAEAGSASRQEHKGHEGEG